MKGQVLKPLERNSSRVQNDPLPGRIRFRAADHSEVEVGSLIKKIHINEIILFEYMLSL